MPPWSHPHQVAGTNVAAPALEPAEHFSVDALEDEGWMQPGGFLSTASLGQIVAEGEEVMALVPVPVPRPKWETEALLERAPIADHSLLHWLSRAVASLDATLLSTPDAAT